MKLPRDKRIYVSLLLIIALAAIFWAGSRYPALNEKAMMGGETEISGLAFDILLEPPLEPNPAQQIFYTAVNWMYTNWKGMTFGLLFAGALMGLMKRVPIGECKNPFTGAVMGTVMGAPLGVCVNCATPIGQGLHESGARPAVSLAAMISSPTLNFVVLTMAFTVLPWYMAALKIGTTVLFLFIFLPILARVLGPKAKEESPKSLSEQICEPATPAESSWLGALSWLARAFPANLWLIVRRTVPAMLLAGLLGAAFISLIPADTIVSRLPGGFGEGAALATLTALLLVAGFGLLLPVPIAFDVILATVLLGAGLPPAYAMALLFTLGIFSIYPWWVISRNISARLAAGVAAVLILLGTATGIAAHYIGEFEDRRFRDHLAKELLGEPEVAWPLRGQKPVTTVELDAFDPPLEIEAPRNWDELSPGISISKRAFATRAQSAAAEAGARFVREDPAELGLDEPIEFNAWKLLQPFTHHRPIAAGDIHRDGWDDIVMGSDPCFGGLTIYANLRGERFERQTIELGDLVNHFVADLALVDVNNDGWLDLVVTTFLEGAFLFRNSGGQFSEGPERIELDSETVMVASLGFGDIDQDGDLDGVLGCWTAGENLEKPDPKYYSIAASANFLLWNDPDGFRREPLSGMPGETLTTLISDFNHDSFPDLIVGNDFNIPDSYYLGDGSGGLRLLTREDTLIPLSAKTTMSVFPSDVDNDLRVELFLAQIAEIDRNEWSSGGIEWWSHHPNADVRRYGVYNELVANSRNRRSLKPMLEVEDSSDRRKLMAIVLQTRLARGHWKHDDPTIERWVGQMIGQFPPEIRIMTEQLRRPRFVRSAQRSLQEIPQRDSNKNVFLVPNEAGFEERTEEFGLVYSHWAWNAKFADLDHDEDQDLYVVNGSMLANGRASNHYFENQNGRRFEMKEQEAGLADRHVTSAYTYIDFDNDGDLDIVSIPIDAPPRVFRNQANDGASVIFEIQDEAGNRFGIGCRIVIHYGPDGKLHQMREILASGGFISHDAPFVHFGLGEHEAIQRVEVFWSTGEKTEITQQLPAGARYTIRRRPES